MGIKCGLATIEEQSYYVLYDVTTLYFELLNLASLRYRDLAKTKNTATVDINRVGGYSGRNSRKFTATVLPQSL